jgi:hypothetical protein
LVNSNTPLSYLISNSQKKSPKPIIEFESKSRQFIYIKC